MSTTRAIARYCITHAKPVVPERFYTAIIALGDYGKDLPWHVSRLDRFWHEARPVAFGSAGPYAIPRIAQASAGERVLGICSHRKILLSRPVSHGDPKTFQIEILPDDLKDLSVADTLPGDPALEFFVANPLFFGDGILGQYTKYHQLQDLLDYTSLAIELGVLTPRQASDFLLCPIFIPGGCEFGTYPRDWLIARLVELEQVGKTFVLRYRDRLLQYDRYQVRALSFLSERLGSYFVLTALTERYQCAFNFSIGNHLSSGPMQMIDPRNFGTVPPATFGRIHVFLESGGGYRSGMAE